MAEKSGNKVNLVVITPYKCFFEGRVSSVVLPSFDGELGVMAGHTPLVVALKPGVCSLRIDNEKKYFAVSDGYAEIGQHLVLIVCNSAEWPEDIVVRQIKESYDAAKEAEATAMRIEDPDARKYALKETNKRKWRAQARIKLIKNYGTDAQKERLSDLGLV